MRHHLPRAMTAPFGANAPRHAVRIGLAGCGGTGSLVLTGLARIHTALVALGHPGLDVSAWDPDTVSPANIGRQPFSPADVGLLKASVLVTRINQFYGLNWTAVPGKHDGTDSHDMIITALDSGPGRATIIRNARTQRRTFYNLDLGNRKTTGQTILGTLIRVPQPGLNDTTDFLPTVLDLYPDIANAENEDTTPSCSLAQALEFQDLFINPAVANAGLQILWHALRHGWIDRHGAFINTETGRQTPLPVDPATWIRCAKRPNHRIRYARAKLRKDGSPGAGSKSWTLRRWFPSQPEWWGRETTQIDKGYVYKLIF